MKSLKSLSLGIILIYVFLISTVALVLILLLNLLPELSRTIINIWLTELFVTMGYCLFFYDARQGSRNRKKNIPVLKH